MESSIGSGRMHVICYNQKSAVIYKMEFILAWEVGEKGV